MRIAVLSGKGGTGKTLVSVNLAAVAQSSSYIDCDVEEPNGYLFFRPEDVREEEISVKIPKVNNVLCNGCRKCVDFCKFNALAYIKDRLIVFDEICHSCGGSLCFALKKHYLKKRGYRQSPERNSGKVTVCTGVLNTGRLQAFQLSKSCFAEKSTGESLEAANQPTFIDCPPGSACICNGKIKDADYCTLVAEPTVFGFIILAWYTSWSGYSISHAGLFSINAWKKKTWQKSFV